MEDVVRRAIEVQRDAQKMLDFDLVMGSFAIDEVAIQCGTSLLLDTMVGYLKYEHGADHFNSVDRDYMQRLDLPFLPMWSARRSKRGFGVRFEFLRLPATLWRIEAMAVLDGSAPLHSQHEARHGDPSVIHASFKCEDVAEYEDVKKFLMDLSTLPFVAEYRNSYGQFSYWQCGRYYLKPRVNTRDVPG